MHVPPIRRVDDAVSSLAPLFRSGDIAGMKSSSNRIRQARRNAKLSQKALAMLVGVHRSAVSQWEQPAGSMPTLENLARIAVTTSVQFEWLATGRGRMKYVSDLTDANETPAILLEYCAQGEVEVRALAALRKLDYTDGFAFVGMLEALADSRLLKLKRKTPYSR
jgi:transcriptional regulator with XRE-family HTH domain